MTRNVAWRLTEQDIPGDQVSTREIFCYQYGLTVSRLVEGQELKVTGEVVDRYFYENLYSLQQLELQTNINNFLRHYISLGYTDIVYV